jgi:hypothetical protein
VTVTLKDSPAKFSKKVLAAIEPVIEKERARLGREPSILDPFAGVGLIHTLGTKTVGVELEPEWAGHHERTKVGDSRYLKRLFPKRRFDMVITSPTYANRMADHHEAKDACKACDGSGTVLIQGVDMDCDICEGRGLSKRNTYRHYLDRMPSEGSSCVMQWGPEYRLFHAEVWEQVGKVVADGGLFVLNISNHIRKFEEQDVSGWHKAWLLEHGWRLVEEIPVRTPRNRQGENGQSRVPHEWVYVFQKVA